MALLALEIGLHELQVFQIHGAGIIVQILLQAGNVKGIESFDACHGFGGGEVPLQACRDLQAHLLGIHRVEQVLLNLRDFFGAEVSDQNIDAGVVDQRLVYLRKHLDTNRGRIGALIVLAGKVANSKCGRSGGHLKFGEEIVEWRLREYIGDGGVKNFLAHPLDVVTVDNAQITQAGNTERIPQLLRQRSRARIGCGFCLYKDAVDHFPALISSAWAPISVRKCL